MELHQLKKEYIRNELSITEDFGRVFTFVDFGNVNNWFAEDRQDWNHKHLLDAQKLAIDLEGLKNFCDVFSQKVRNYYGNDPHNQKSQSFTYAMRKIFGKRNIITKPLQKIKHYLDDSEKTDETLKNIKNDRSGHQYIEIRKCNFDVELSVDALKMIDHYDTFCLFSGDADFVYLNEYLKKKGKRIILIKGGHITADLRASADLVINAQKIKKHIAYIK